MQRLHNKDDKRTTIKSLSRLFLFLRIKGKNMKNNYNKVLQNNLLKSILKPHKLNRCIITHINVTIALNRKLQIKNLNV